MKKALLAFVFLQLAIVPIFAQTLVTRSWIAGLGQQTMISGFSTSTLDAQGGFYNLSNTYITGQQEDYAIGKYGSDGQNLWEVQYNNLTNGPDFGADIYAYKGFVYVTGVSIDSGTTTSKFKTLKVDTADGTIVWSASYTAAYSGYAVAGRVRVDTAGNVYVVGTEQTAPLDFAMTLVKYNSSGTQQWVSHVDSAGFYDGAVGLTVGNYISITGFSGSGFGSWDFSTASFMPSTGALHASNRSGNGNGSFSKPVDIVKDETGALYVLGTSQVSGANTDLKLIKYNDACQELWVKVWGDSVLPDVAEDMQHEIRNGKIVITGTASNALGGKDLVTVKYDTSGTKVWDRKLSNANPSYELSGKAVMIDDSGDPAYQGTIYLSGKQFNGSDFDIVTLSYNPAGTMRWRQVYDRGAGINDESYNILCGNGTAIVVGASLGIDTMYLAMQYEEQEDSLGIGVLVPEYITNRLQYTQQIFEGKVKETHPYFNASHDYIYTSNVIEIRKVFKGTLECGTVEIITLGGTVNDTTLSLSHNIELRPGEIGLFLANSTTRDSSLVDFYAESNGEKLYLPYSQESFIKYYNDGINKRINESWVALDSIKPLYNLLNTYEWKKQIICEGGSMEVPEPEQPFEFPHYSKDSFNAQMALIHDRASRAITPSARSIGTFTYTLQNPIITGTTTKYLEFDVALSDNISSGWMVNAAAHILYNTTIFGSDIVANNKIAVTRGTVTASSTDYMTPALFDYSTGVVAIAMTGETSPTSLYALTDVPTQAIHVKMEIANCNVPNVTVQFTNNTEMLNAAVYAGIPNPTLSSPLYDYNVSDNSSSFPMPACRPTILGMSPNPINSGVEDTLRISGYQFGSSRGTGGVYMPNADNGGRTYMRFDSRDYLYWSDTLIAVVVPSVADTANNNNTGFGGAGTGTLRVKVNGGDTTSSSNPLTIFYAASNSIDSMALGRKKYVNSLFDYLGTGGYRFSIDTSISNHANLKSCVIKAIHDWVCLTTINFEVGNDTISTTNKATKDNINMIQVGRADDSTVIARTSQWITGKCSVIDKVSVSEIDLLVNPIFLNDLFGDTANVPLPATKIDFYSVMIHELGHAHSLDHVIDKNAIMHWDVTRGPQTAAQRRIRLYNDASCADGGSFIVDETQNPYFSTLCGWSEMLLNNTGNCSLFNSMRKPFAVNDIKFYPNPVTESLVIEYAIDKPATIEVQVYNILGEIVYSSHGQSQAGMNKEVLSSEQWTNGFYIVNVKINNQNNIAKIIKN